MTTLLIKRDTPEKLVRAGIVTILCWIFTNSLYAQTPSNTDRKKNQQLESIQVDDLTVREVIESISETSGLNIVATAEAAEAKVTMTLRNVRVIDAIEIMAKITGLWYREEEATETIRLMTTEEYQEDLIVFRNDTTRVFTLLHPNALSIAQTIRSLYGPRVVLSLQPFDDDVLVGTRGILGLGGGTAVGGSGGFGGGGFGNAGAGGFGNGGSGFGGGGFGGGAFGGGSGGGAFGGGGFGGNGGFGGGGLGGGGLGGNGGFGGGFSAGGAGGQNGITFGAPLFETKELPGNPLTPDQVVALQSRMIMSERGQEGVTAEDVQDVTSREPLIYVAHNKTHSLVIIRTSDEDAMKSIERLVIDLDRPTPEVLLEMKILKVRLTDNFRSILDVQYTAGPLGPSVAEQQARNPFVQNPASAVENVLGLVNSPDIGGATSFVYQYLSDNLRARLELLQQQECVTSIASPVLLSSNNRPARIFVGEQRVMVTGVDTTVITPGTGAATSNVTPQTEVVNIGTTLLILPKINADRSVTLSLYEDQSEIDPKSQELPVSDGNGGVTEFKIDSIKTSNMEATVVAQDGLTIAVGGLITDDSRLVERRVPGLHRLPWIGNLFRQYIDENEKTELILLITPHVITTPMEGQYKSQARIQALSDHPVIRSQPSCPDDALNYRGSLSGLGASLHEWDETEVPQWRSEEVVEVVEEIPSP